MESSIGIISTIGQAFEQGGIWMWAILAAQIVSFAIIGERVFHLYFLRSPKERRLVRGFEKDIKSGQIKKAINTPVPVGQIHPIYPVVKAGAQAAATFGGRDEIQAKMDEILIFENEKLNRRTGFLAVIGNVGTLLGLLGTIVGLIKAFSSVANVNPVEKAAMLTQGISMAMNTTAYGLIVAIPALVAFAILQNRSNTLTEDLNQAALKAFNWLSFNFEPVSRKKSQ